MQSTLSILGLYNYDNTIFDNFNLPVGIEKNDVVDNLLVELAELEILYPNPSTMKTIIGIWSKKELPIWEKLLATTKFEYNPLENLYRYEEYNDKETRDLTATDVETRNLSTTDTETRNLSLVDTETRDLTATDVEIRNLSTSDTETRNLLETKDVDTTSSATSTNSGTDTTKEYIGAFNSATPTLSKQIENTLGSGNTTSGTVGVDEEIANTGTVTKDIADTGSVSKDLTDSGTVTKDIADTGTVNNAKTDTGTVNNTKTDSGTVEKIQTVTMKGSIGVVTPQQMIEQERNVVKFNVIDYIIDSFKKRFCLLIY